MTICTTSADEAARGRIRFLPVVRRNVKLLVTVVGTAFVGCIVPSGQGDNPPTNQVVAPGGLRSGRILVEVSTGVVHVTDSPRQRYWRYEVDPSSGRIVQTEAGVGELKESRLATGRSGCDKYDDKTRILLSPDGRFQVQCGEEDRGEPARFIVSDMMSKKVLFTWLPHSMRRVRGFAWSPTSEFVALLCYSERTRSGLVDRVWASAGHPPPYVTFFVDLINVAEGTMTEYVLRSDVVFGDGAILDWTSPPAKTKLSE
jgi:hypothetical protein